MGKQVWKRIDGFFTESRVALLCAVVLGLSLLPLCGISIYNHPCSDDYNYGLYVSQAVRAGGSLWDVLVAAARETTETYFDWQGTFSAVFLMALQPAAFGERFYILTPYLMVGSLLFSNFFFLKEVCVRRLGMSRSAWVTISCVMGFFMVHFAPSAFEGFFWYNGSVFYTFFHSLMLCALTFLLKFLRVSTSGRKIACGVTAAVLCFFLGAGNYPTALLTWVILLGTFIWTFHARRPRSQRWVTLICLLLETGAFALSVLAPGNSVRQAYFESRPGAVQSVILALGASIQKITQWSTLPLLIALLFLVPLFCRYAAQLSFQFRWPLAAILASVCVLGILLTPPIYAMGGTGAGRMEDLYYNTFCLLAPGVVFYLCGWVTHHASLKRAPKQLQVSTSAFLLALIIPFCLTTFTLKNFKSLTGVSALRSLISQDARAYSAQVDEQLELLEDPNLTDVVLESVTYRPELLMPTSVPLLSDDPNATANQRVATFYGKNSVIAVNRQ